MADSKKSTVVIASVLKPVDDSRMYEKVGLALAGMRDVRVHVIGTGPTTNNNEDIPQHSIGTFGRLSIGRLLAPWKILLMALRLRPDILIITTHELLYPAMVLKLARKCRIIYDVQENYYWNILYTSAFPVLLRPFIALYVRGKETLLARYVDHFFLAEKGYEQELRFPGNKYTVIENKVRVEEVQKKLPASFETRKKIHLIFSGTLAETTGVFTAIDLAVKLHVIDERFTLTIIGFASQTAVLEKIRLLIRPRPFIELITADSPVPHAQIFKRLHFADFGLVTYQINPSTMNSIPTKLYEYLGFRLPMVMVNHKPWVDFCQRCEAAVVFDPARYDAGAIYREMMQRKFYSDEPKEVYWDSEEPKLLTVIRGLKPAPRPVIERVKVLQ